MAEKGKEEKEVWLYQYDLTNGMATKIVKFMTGRDLEAVWHTALVVFGKEYFFGGGICSGHPGCTPYGTPIKKSLFGKTTKTQKEFEDYLNTIDNVYNAENYHIYNNNCNHFTNAIALYLCNKGLSEDILNQCKCLEGTEFGKWLIPRLENLSQGQKCVPEMIEGKKEDKNEGKKEDVKEDKK